MHASTLGLGSILALACASACDSASPRAPAEASGPANAPAAAPEPAPPAKSPLPTAGTDAPEPDAPEPAAESKDPIATRPAPSPRDPTKTFTPTAEQTRAYAAALQRGRKQTRAKDYDAAVAAFTEALDAIPRDPRASSGRGYARLLAGLLDEAEADLLAALSAGPPRKLQAMIDFNLGLLEERRGSTEAALEYFRRSAVLRPSKATRAKLEGLTAASACPSFDPARVEGRRHDGWLALHEDMRKALTADAPHRTVGSPASAAEARATLCNHLDQDRCTGTAPWVVTLDAGDEWGATAVAVVIPDGEALRASATRVLTLECMEGGSAMDLRIDAGAWVLVTFDLGCDGYGFECDDDDPAVQEEGVVACEKNFYHVAERTQWVLVPGTLEQRAEIHTTGELDGWLEDQAVPFDLELALDGDHAVLTGSCSLRAPLR